jgi:hypothetical protein
MNISIKSPLSFLPSGGGGAVDDGKGGARALVRALPNLLTWKSGTALVDEAVRFQEAWIFRRLYLWQSNDSRRLVEQFMALPQASKKRLLNAPLFHVLLSRKRLPTPEMWDQLGSILAVEQYLLGDRGKVEQRAWSALGDVSVPPAEGDTEMFQAAYLRGVLLDASSPNVAKSWIFPGLGAVAHYTKAEMAGLQSKIEDHLEHIYATAPAAGYLVTNSIKVLALGKSAESSSIAASMSARVNIGLVGLGNLHSSHWTPATLSEALVHEAIHSVIYRLELFQSLYTDERAAWTEEIVSPWSGRTLKLHSFVHASYVWFGIWNFWRQRTSAWSSSENEAKALKGFLHRDPSEESFVPNRFHKFLQPFVLETIDKMVSFVHASMR